MFISDDCTTFWQNLRFDKYARDPCANLNKVDSGGRWNSTLYTVQTGKFSNRSKSQE